MPFTSWGTREILLAAGLFVVVLLALTVLSSFFAFPHLMWLIAPFAVVLFWVFWFFRDPERAVPAEPGLIVSPADGTITHLDLADEADFIGGQALRCSIFLSIFDVHLNRAPLSGKVAYVKFRSGEFFDARREESLVKNQNQDIGILPDEPGMPEKALVRQSTGAIARNIVCPVDIGRSLLRGERYGMIKFGSRTTLFLSKEKEVVWRVAVGDKVKAGETVLAELKNKE